MDVDDAASSRQLRLKRRKSNVSPLGFSGHTVRVSAAAAHCFGCSADNHNDGIGISTARSNRLGVPSPLPSPPPPSCGHSSM